MSYLERLQNCTITRQQLIKRICIGMVWFTAAECLFIILLMTKVFH